MKGGLFFSIFFPIHREKEPFLRPPLLISCLLRFFPPLGSPSVSKSVFFEGFLFTHFSQLILSIIEILVSSLFSSKVLLLLSLFAHNSYFHSCRSITPFVYLLFLAFLSVQLFKCSIQYLFDSYAFNLFPVQSAKTKQNLNAR